MKDLVGYLLLAVPISLLVCMLFEAKTSIRMGRGKLKKYKHQLDAILQDSTLTARERAYELIALYDEALLSYGCANWCHETLKPIIIEYLEENDLEVLKQTFPDNPYREAPKIDIVTQSFTPVLSATSCSDRAMFTRKGR